MDCSIRGSHAQSVHLTHYTSHIRTARVKQEEEANTGIIEKVWYEYESNERGYCKEKGSIVMDLTIIELS